MSEETFYMLDKDNNCVPCTLDQWVNFINKNGSLIFKTFFHSFHIVTNFIGTDSEKLFETAIYLTHNDASNGLNPLQNAYSKSYKDAITVNKLAMEWAFKFKNCRGEEY